MNENKTMAKQWNTRQSVVRASVCTLPPYRSAAAFYVTIILTPREWEIGFGIKGMPVAEIALSFQRGYNRLSVGILGLSASVSEDYTPEYWAKKYPMAV